MNRKNKANYKTKNKRPPLDREAADGHNLIVKQDVRHPIIALPEISPSPVYRQSRRFIASSAVNGNLTIANLLDQFMIQVSTALGVSYVKALRVAKLKLLAPVQTQGTSVQLKVQPIGIDSGNNSFSGVPETYQDTSASIDVPAYLELKPKIDTPLGSWHFSVNVDLALLYIVAPQGTTFDIVFEFILNNEAAASSYTNTLVTGTVGTLYSRNIVTNFVPQSATVK